MENLDKTVRKFRAEDILFIGSEGGASFMFIGTPDEFNRDIDAISKAKIDSATKRNEQANELIKKLEKSMPTLKRESAIPSFCESITSWARKLKAYDQTRRSTRRYIEEFTMLRTREVKEVYKRIEGDGTVIIVKGNDSGSCWFLDEYRKGQGVEETKEEE